MNDPTDAEKVAEVVTKQLFNKFNDSEKALEAARRTLRNVYVIRGGNLDADSSPDTCTDTGIHNLGDKH